MPMASEMPVIIANSFRTLPNEMAIATAPETSATYVPVFLTPNNSMRMKIHLATPMITAQISRMPSSSTPMAIGLATHAQLTTR